MTAAHQEADEIVLGTDGAYWWVYELKLLKKTSILFVVWKILGGAFVGIWMFVVFLSAGDEGFWWGGFLYLAMAFALLILGMLVLSFIGYLLYAAVMGETYCVLFEINEHGIRHAQLTKQFRKAQAFPAAAALLTAGGGWDRDCF